MMQRTFHRNTLMALFVLLAGSALLLAADTPTTTKKPTTATKTTVRPAPAIPAAAKKNAPAPATGNEQEPTDDRPGVVRCANLTYAANKTSVCFSDKFLEDIQTRTHITTDRKFMPVRLEDEKLYRYPFAIMTGEGPFTLTEAQRKALADYLKSGGFLVASSGCSSDEWADSFQKEIKKVFPKQAMKTIPMKHPIFQTVFDIKELQSTKRSYTPVLQGLEIDGRIVMVYSKDGLNDTGAVGGNCCCCGGNEIANARQINANLLAYALTH